MDPQIIFYIIVAIVFVVSRFLKKQEGNPKDIPTGTPERRSHNLPQGRVNPTSVPQKALTFEELLREIQQAKTPAPETPRQKQLPPRSYEETIEEEEDDLEDVDYDYRKKDSVYDVYEESKKQAFNRPSLEETMRVGDTVVSYERFKVFEQEQRRDVLSEYLADLRDPEGFKKAVVMNEILQRKF